MKKKRIGILITARLKSTRLPLKLVKEVNGKIIIERVIERCKLVEGIDEIVLCTSTHNQDFPLIEIAKKQGIYYFNGDEEDVLSRLCTAAKLFGFDYFIATSGENFLFSIDHYNDSVKQVKEKPYDFIYYTGLPIGCAPYMVNVKAIEVVCKVKQVIDTEIWGRLLNRPDVFDVLTIPVESELKWDDLRLTVDYPEDFELLKNIIEHFESKGIELIELKDVIQFLRSSVEIRNINIDRKQMDISPEDVKRIDHFYESNKESILELKNKIYKNV